MTEKFEGQLARVSGTIHRVYMDKHQHRMENGLLYYRNKADDLRRSADILMAAGGPRGISTMLAGMALEVLLKGTARALGNPAKSIHNLVPLAEHVGIDLSDDEQVLLNAMSEYVIWAGRYTAPLREQDWVKMWEIQEKQCHRSGNIADLEIPTRTLSPGTFHQLWMKFVTCFDRAQQSRYESAEFSWEQNSNTSA